MSFPPTVGRYRIDRVLGSGAFASVWLGHDDALDSQVAIKVLSGSLLDDLDVRNRFLEEARILRRADSARLVRVHDIGELPDGRPYFVMSYADRGTLADRMNERPLPVNTALALAEEIAHGVEVINTLGVIHRDLKPSNVLFQSAPDGGERLLIADLGLAKALAHASGAFTLPVGTPGYMSPEQARFGGGLDVRADVYGLGALSYHMLTGRAPGPVPVRTPPSELRDDLPPALDQVILRALEVERERRWPTASAFAEALAALRPDTPPAPAPAPDPMSAPAPYNPVSGSDPDATVMDRPQPGPASAPPSHTAQGPPSHGPPPPLPAPPSGPGPGSSEFPTQLDEPVPGNDRTSEMHTPPAQQPSDSGESTIIDQPSAAHYPGAHDATEPGGDQTVGLPTPPPPPPGGGREPVDNKTAVFPLPPSQQPQQPQAPQPQPQPPLGGNGPGATGPGGPGGPAGPGVGQPPYPAHQSPPPTGFQPPPPGPGGGAAARSGGPGGQGGGEKPKKFLTPLIITAVVLAVALAGGLALGTLFSKDDGGGGGGEKLPAVPADFAPVSDQAGKIKVSAPKAWPAQQAQTWKPSSVGLKADPTIRPVLRATPSVPGFLGDGKSPGVFIGMTTDLTAGQLPPPLAAKHGGCTPATPENYTSPDKALSGTITRYTGCTRGTPSVTEVGLKDKTGKFGAWVRVKETDDRSLTKAILNTLKLTAP
ncbi:serine/threonine-protein kinase [Spirillospora sp. NBC_01491]|uniref:serine/threonine-protein kinase n=1 Tax=Spirillospora sp. NBC_01491 TaxID=2976007 RepID=UPI002E381464|nr:serine/threonine-protein kinase [Spirillospora sp. NBC_01491]